MYAVFYAIRNFVPKRSGWVPSFAFLTLGSCFGDERPRRRRSSIGKRRTCAVFPSFRLRPRPAGFLFHRLELGPDHLRLEIAMNDPVGMGESDPVADLQKDV